MALLVLTFPAAMHGRSIVRSGRSSRCRPKRDCFPVMTIYPRRAKRLHGRRQSAVIALTMFMCMTGSLKLNLRSEEHTSELQSLMRISYAVFCLKKKKTKQRVNTMLIEKHHGKA